MTKNCIQCGKSFSKKPRFSLKWWATAKYCSQGCSSKSKIGKPNGMLGKKHKPETLEKMSRSRLGVSSHWNIGRTAWNKGKRCPEMSRENHWAWKKDRSTLQKYGDDNKDRRSAAYRVWRKEVWLRDNFVCKIANPDCAGRIEAHHILGWKAHPGLRYEVNNGITLCHFHHPRKRNDEMRLSPYFQEIVNAKLF